VERFADCYRVIIVISDDTRRYRVYDLLSDHRGGHFFFSPENIPISFSYFDSFHLCRNAHVHVCNSIFLLARSSFSSRFLRRPCRERTRLIADTLCANERPCSFFGRHLRILYSILYSTLEEARSFLSVSPRAHRAIRRYGLNCTLSQPWSRLFKFKLYISRACPDWMFQ